MERRNVHELILMAASFLVISALVFSAGKAEEYPKKSIDLIVFSSAGGGTDVVARHMAAQMEKILGQKILVSNQPAAGGVAAMETVWQKPRDGYTLLGCAIPVTLFKVNGMTKYGMEEWEFYLASGSSGVIAVKADSPYKSIQDFVRAAAAKPGEIKISNSGKGKNWHMKSAMLEKVAGVQFKHLPYAGSNPAILSVLSNESDAVSASVQEVSEHVKAGKLRILITTEDKRIGFAEFSNVPSITELYPAASKYFPSFQWLGFAVPADTPERIRKTLGEAFMKVMNSPETDTFYKGQYLEKIALWGEAAKKYVVDMQSILSWMAFDLGVAANDPTALKIPRPAGW